ncbi:MAG TPA: hypothetical protein VJ895_00295 [Candidatus Nanoarchaeia archaeon]|nr:hypothetical protein [Candidatus Nanoarchaeia archaeon]
MKKSVISFVFAIIFLFSFASVSAACDLDVSLINQDPYPAIPGEYVKLVFQISGVDNPECGMIDFELLEQYPLIFDPNEKRIYSVDSGIYHRNYKSFLLATYKVRVDSDAMDGDNPIETNYRYGSRSVDFQNQFDINIEDTRADFEIHVKDYDLKNNQMTLEVLNIAKVDVEALTLEISNQENIQIKGSKFNIVGDLDSNDYTTANFEAIPQKGEFNVKIHYTDNIGERRSLEKSVLFESEYFEERTQDQKEKSPWTYVIWIAIVLLIVYYFWKRHKKKKSLKKKLAKK